MNHLPGKDGICYAVRNVRGQTSPPACAWHIFPMSKQTLHSACWKPAGEKAFQKNNQMLWHGDAPASGTWEVPVTHFSSHAAEEWMKMQWGRATFMTTFYSNEVPFSALKRSYSFHTTCMQAGTAAQMETNPMSFQHLYRHMEAIYSSRTLIWAC